MYPFKLFCSLLFGGLAGLLIVYGYPALLKEYDLPNWLKMTLSAFGLVFAFIVGKATFEFLSKNVLDPETAKFDEYSLHRRDFVINWLKRTHPELHNLYSEKIIFPPSKKDTFLKFKDNYAPHVHYRMFQTLTRGASRKFDEMNNNYEE